ncbi:MAG TPA: hypothetical protein VHM26_18285 [Chitinophagaceae bacterium]|nr:hypothetical protein [Chitinophagaceae bacterium]
MLKLINSCLVSVTLSMVRIGTLLCFILLISSCKKKGASLEEVLQFPSYPSASAIEYFRNHYYIMGDDATHLLVLDSSLHVSDSIRIAPGNYKRIPKDIKQDFEAASIVHSGNSRQLLLTGSGSVTPTRDSACLYDIEMDTLKTFSLDTFYRRIKARGLEELNLEGACATSLGFIFASRGHKAFRKNYLVMTSSQFWEKQSTAPIALIKIGANIDSNSFQGVSGLAYIRNGDRLLISVSTEDTKSVHEDGAIGKSYLWIVDNISAKRRWNSINPNRVIDLEKTDSRFKGNKIESVCVIKETRRGLQLALVADNDDGGSKLFILDISL